MRRLNKSFSNFVFKRLITTASTNRLERLQNRTLLRVSGAEVSSFLQGLITNNIEHLKSGPGSMYTLFLNNSGRILFDSIIYRTDGDDTYLIECDKQISSDLHKHLRLHRVRRKIDIADLTNELQMYVLFNPSRTHFSGTDPRTSIESSVACEKLNAPVSPTSPFKKCDDLFVYQDPRIASLGARIVANVDTDVREKLGEIAEIEGEPDARNYRWLRYSLGVGEGIQDLPPGECFPLECNGDYLHGVSFHKGCYVGQELTARVHHTGVVRKRLMPVYFTQIPSKLPDGRIIHENVNLGRLKGVESGVGLALLRINKVLALKEIKFGDGSGVTRKPNWWPIEAPKEIIPKSQ